MNDKIILKNIGISMLMKPISMVLSLIYIPLVLSYLGETKYGIWVIVLDIISWISYFDIGIGNGLRNKLTEAITYDDNDLAQNYVSTAYIGTIIISILFFIGFTVIWFLLDLQHFFNLTLDDENTNYAILMSVFLISINFVISLSKTFAYAIQRPGIIGVVGVIGQLFQITAVVIVSKVCSQNLLVIATVYGSIGLIDGIVIFLIVTHNRDFLKPNLFRAKIKYLKPLLTLGIGFFILQISTLVLNTTDNLLISNLYGSAKVTPYNTVYKVFYMVVQIHAIIIMPMWNAYTEAAARKDLLWIKKTLKWTNIIAVLFSCAVVIGIFVFEPIAEIWLHKKLEYGSCLIPFVAIYMIIQMIANNFSSFLCGIGYIKVSITISIIGAVLNIPLSIIFSKTCDMELSGVILGSIVVMMISFIALPIVSNKWIKNKSVEWGLK